MTIPKDKVIPGTIGEVTNAGNGINSQFVVMSGPADGFSATALPCGAKFEIIGKPKLTEGIKCVKIRYAGQDCWAYYTHVRYAAKI